MKLSTKGIYGLRAMIDLAQNADGEAVSISSISKRQDISEGYLEQIISLLKRSGLLKSKRGAGGGYALSRPLEEISVGDILRSLEGSLEPVECPGLQADQTCASEEVCVSKYVWKRINDSINQTVDEISLRELVDIGRNVSDQTDAGQRRSCGGAGKNADADNRKKDK